MAQSPNPECHFANLGLIRFRTFRRVDFTVKFHRKNTIITHHDLHGCDFVVLFQIYADTLRTYVPELLLIVALMTLATWFETVSPALENDEDTMSFVENPVYPVGVLHRYVDDDSLLQEFFP